MLTGKTLIRLGWSESSLGAHAILLVLSWDDSIMIFSEGELENHTYEGVNRRASTLTCVSSARTALPNHTLDHSSRSTFSYDVICIPWVADILYHCNHDCKPSFGIIDYCNDPKFLVRIVFANSVDPNQTAQSDLGLHSLPFHLHTRV